MFPVQHEIALNRLFFISSSCISFLYLLNFKWWWCRVKYEEWTIEHWKGYWWTNKEVEECQVLEKVSWRQKPNRVITLCKNKCTHNCPDQRLTDSMHDIVNLGKKSERLPQKGVPGVALKLENSTCIFLSSGGGQFTSSTGQNTSWPSGNHGKWRGSEFGLNHVIG
jgi:hypothetical protein